MSLTTSPSGRVTCGHLHCPLTELKPSLPGSLPTFWKYHLDCGPPPLMLGVPMSLGLMSGL